MTISNLKIISFLFLFVIAMLSMASAQTKTDSLEALLQGLQGNEKIEAFEQLIELNTKSAPEKAIEFGRQTLELLEHFEDTKMEINILNKMCSAYTRVGKDSVAIKLGNKSLKLAEKVNDRNGQAGALNEIGKVYRKSGEYQKALDCHSRSLKIYEELNDRQNVGRLTMDIGIVYELLSNYNQAMANHKKSLKVFEETDDEEGVALLLIRIGYVYSRLGEYERALEYGFNSLKINEQIDNKIGIANSLGHIGNTYWRLGKYDKALDYNLQSLKIKEEFGDKWSIAPALANVGLVYNASGNHTHALQYYFKALELYQEVGDKHHTRIVLNNIGTVKSNELNDQKSALEYFFKSLKIAEGIGDKYGIALSFNNIGVVYKRLGKYKEAINYETKALAIGKDIKSKHMKKICYEALYELYASMGDFKNALENHKLFKSINDSIFTEKSSKKIAEMQVKYKTEKKEKEIELLQSNAIIQSMEMDKQKNYRNLAIISFVFILVVAILLFIGYYHKKRLNILLREKNKLLERTNRELEKEITQRKRTEKELKKHAGLLEESNKALESFTYSVSHDLKAPLRAINGFSEILSEDYNDKLDDEAKRLINVIRKNARNMNQLITDLLDFSRLGRQQIKTIKIDIETLARKIFDEQRRIYPKRNIEFILGEIPSATGDRNLIRLVFLNLITNAVKFTEPGKIARIEIGSLQKNKQLFYYVKDNGIGFEMKYAGKIFGVFQRLHSSEEFEGTGVGLAIVQKIIHKHGGEVIAEGEVDKGATFYFSLPNQ